MAVGEADDIGATMLVSSNGLSWQRWYLNTPNGLYDITVSTNQFVAVGGNGEVQTSCDGQYWFSHPVTNILFYPLNPPSPATSNLFQPYFNSIVWGGGMFVAVGDGGAINTSPDGLHWTQQAIGSWPNRFFQAVAYGNGTIVVMGQSGALAVSTNGVDWTEPPRPTGRDIEDAFFAEGQFVAVGEKGYVATSTDGIVWTQHEDHCQNDLRGVAYQGSHFIAVGNNETILQSGFLGPPVLHARGPMGAEGFEMSIEGELGRTYQVQGSEDMQTWEDLMLFTNEQETTVFLDTDAAGWGCRFYRVTVP